ncbi:hypothetical protein D3C80_1152830 [compost metagenome]
MPEVVVLPAPCRPAIIITVGGLLALASFAWLPPISSVSSLLTMSMMTMPGVKLSITSLPTDFSFTLDTKSLTTLKLTSASRSARRTSRMASFTSSSDTFPLPRSLLNTFCNLPVKPSNAICGLLPSCYSNLCKRSTSSVNRCLYCSGSIPLSGSLRSSSKYRLRSSCLVNRPSFSS